MVTVLKDTEKVDLVVVLAHEGLEKDIVVAKILAPLENQVYAIATTVPGIDVILTGHTHLSIRARRERRSCHAAEECGRRDLQG